MRKRLIAGFVLLCGLCGCTTTITVKAAKGSGTEGSAQPAFYLLVPIAVPVDVVGTPFYYLLWAAHTDDPSCGRFFRVFSMALQNGTQ